MREKQEPLTEQEKAFANQYHNLIYKFMAVKKLTMEWYDVVAIGYLKAVQKWFKREDLHQYCFSTIAFNKMCCEVGIEREKKKRRLKTISLDAVMQHSFTFGDVITNKNLIYVAYIGGEDMEIKYNVEMSDKIRAGRKKSEALIALDKFLLSDNKNICFNFEGDTQEAQKVYNNMQTYRTRTKAHKLYNVHKYNDCVYVEKTEEFLKKVEQERKNRERKEQICTSMQ